MIRIRGIEEVLSRSPTNGYLTQSNGTRCFDSTRICWRFACKNQQAKFSTFRCNLQRTVYHQSSSRASSTSARLAQRITAL